MVEPVNDNTVVSPTHTGFTLADAVPGTFALMVTVALLLLAVPPPLVQVTTHL